jgi:hypothetical protein
MKNHEGKDLAVMFLLVLVLLLLFSFIEIRLLVFGQDRVVVPPRASQVAFSERDLAPWGFAPDP